MPCSAIKSPCSMGISVYFEMRFVPTVFQWNDESSMLTVVVAGVISSRHLCHRILGALRNLVRI